MPGHPLADAIGLWPMNSLGNKVFDSSGNGNIGIFTGDVSWVTGKYGLALDFPGTNDYITFAHSQCFAFNDAFTIHLRGRVDTDFDGMFLYHYDPVTQDGYYIQYEDADNKIYGVVFVGGLAILCETNVAITLGQTYDITFVRDSAGFCTLYLDAVAQTDTDTLAGAIDSTDPIYLGCNRVLAKDLDGQIEYVILYNRALFASEIDFLCREPFCMFSENIMPEFGIAA